MERIVFPFPPQQQEASNGPGERHLPAPFLGREGFLVLFIIIFLFKSHSRLSPFAGTLVLMFSHSDLKLLLYKEERSRRVSCFFILQLLPYYRMEIPRETSSREGKFLSCFCLPGVLCFQSSLPYHLAIHWIF